MRMRIIRFDSSGWSKWLDDESGDIVYAKFGIAPSGSVEVHGLYLDRRINTDASASDPNRTVRSVGQPTATTRGTDEDPRSVR